MSEAIRERRIHKVFVTRNTEYHVRRALCVGVRDRRSGEWLRSHLALRCQLAGSLRFTEDGGVEPRTSGPSIGESLFFQAQGRDLVTSTVVSVDRPPRELVAQYVA